MMDRVSKESSGWKIRFAKDPAAISASFCSAQSSERMLEK
jgi:hypothetical protein